MIQDSWLDNLCIDFNIFMQKIYCLSNGVNFTVDLILIIALIEAVISLQYFVYPDIV